MTVGALAWEGLPAMADDAGSDEALMLRFQRGDRAAFDELFRRYAAPLTSFLTRLTGSAAAAEDAVQLTFLSVNAARDRHRRTRRETPVAEDVVEAGLDAVHGDAGLRRRLLEALQQLPEPQREAVILHRLEGWSFAEIADAVGASETAVKVRAFRGTQVLREALKDVWEFES
jgi:RNA polymerase sigma-70 factor (ECF subfamily)